MSNYILFSLTNVLVILFVSGSTHTSLIPEIDPQKENISGSNLNVKTWYTSRFVCQSNRTLDSCSTISPQNKIYDSLKQNTNSSCVDENLEVCLEIEDRKCIIHFMDLQEVYIGVWRCLIPPPAEFQQEVDAMILRKSDILYDLNVFDSFNITSTLIKGVGKHRI